MNNDMEQQKRVFLAIALSIVFFFAYDFLYLSKSMPKKDVNVTTLNLVEEKKNIKSAPNISSGKEVSSVTETSIKTDEIIATIKAKSYEIEIDRLGRVYSFYLNDEKFAKQDKDLTETLSSLTDGTKDSVKRLQLIDQNKKLYPLEIRFTDEKLNEEAFKTPYIASSNEVKLNNDSKEIILTQKLSSLSITKKLKFYENGKYDISISLSKPKSYFITNGFRPGAVVDMYAFHGSTVKVANGNLETFEDGDVEKVSTHTGSFFVASSDRYYTTTFFAPKNTLDVVIDYDSSNNPLSFIKANSDINFHGYIGPKDYDVLKSIDKNLTDVIEYGFFTFIAKPLFVYIIKPIFDLVGNWGWAIVITTILIRFAMYPLTYKGMLSMARLKDLQPKLKDIQTKYKDDKQKLSIKTMELYQKEKVNPIGGCLPLLLQIPVFFAMYRVFINSIELKGAEWILWITDLSSHDPYFILPVLVGVTMYLHQVITPTTITDPMQAKIMKYLPVIFTVFFVMFPAGLNLYWFVNNLFSMGQQYYINSIITKRAKK